MLFLACKPLHMLLPMTRREYPLLSDSFPLIHQFSAQMSLPLIQSRCLSHVITGIPTCLFLELSSHYIGTDYLLMFWSDFKVCEVSNLQFYSQVLAQWWYVTVLNEYLLFNKLPKSTDYPDQASTLSIWHVNPILLITKWLVDLVINMFSHIKESPTQFKPYKDFSHSMR